MKGIFLKKTNGILYKKQPSISQSLSTFLSFYCIPQKTSVREKDIKNRADVFPLRFSAT